MVVAVAGGVATPALAHDDCPHFDLDDLRASVEDADVIVVGELVTLDGAPAVDPEVYLKGSAVTQTLVLAGEASECEEAELPPAGARVVVALRREAGGFQWPVPAALFVVEDGIATNGAEPAASLPEEELVSRIREVSGQYAVLAVDPSEGASVNWLGVVLPVALAAAIILGIALVLLRIWHRIEPE